MIVPTVQSLDTTGLTQAVNLAQGYSSRTPSEAVATAGFFVARKTTRDVRRATVGGIDSKLGVASSVSVSAKGKKKYSTTFPRLGQSLTVADKIIFARMWPDSEVNKEENYRWAMLLPSFYGNKQEIIATVRAEAKKEVARRHKSIAFIASAARAIVKALEPFVKPQYRRGAVADDSEARDAMRYANTPKGEATVTANGNQAVMQGDMTIGIGGIPPNLGDKHNEAMNRYMPGPLQSAIQSEAASTMNYVAKQELKALEGKFRATGTVIT